MLSSAPLLLSSNGCRLVSPSALARPAFVTFSNRTADWEGQAETLRGKLTSIRNAAGRREDTFYQQWLLARNVGDTAEAVLAFIGETAEAALML